MAGHVFATRRRRWLVAVRRASRDRLEDVTAAPHARPDTATMSAPLDQVDPDIAELLGKELGRQRDTLEMIASENFVPRAVLQAQGSVLTNKYAEGLPGRRYYGGCEYVDVVENIARDRAKELFGAEFANVQPHAGAQANAAVLHALMSPGSGCSAWTWPTAGT